MASHRASSAIRSALFCQRSLFSNSAVRFTSSSASSTAASPSEDLLLSDSCVKRLQQIAAKENSPMHLRYSFLDIYLLICMASKGRGSNSHSWVLQRPLKIFHFSALRIISQTRFSGCLWKAAAAQASNISSSLKIPPAIRHLTTTKCSRRMGRESWWTRLLSSTSEAPRSTSTPSSSGPRSESSTTLSPSRAARAARRSPSRLTNMEC